MNLIVDLDCWMKRLVSYIHIEIDELFRISLGGLMPVVTSSHFHAN